MCDVFQILAVLNYVSFFTELSRLCALVPPSDSALLSSFAVVDGF